MFGIGIFAVLAGLAISVGAGLATAIFLRKTNSYYQIHRWEFVIGVAAIMLITTPLVNFVGAKIAHANAVGGYVEYWGGSIVAANSSAIECSRDGSCAHEYNCDVYYVPVTRKVGKTTITTWEPRWHRCPYANREYSFWLEDSFGGKHYIAEHIFAAEPQKWRGNGDELPGGVARGIPTEWATAKSQIESGDAPPATRVHEYDNYFLAVQSSILREYGGDVQKYQERKLLVPHTQNYKEAIYDRYKARKMVAAGPDWKLANEDLWQDNLSRLNAKLGATLQGDLHIVAVPANLVSSSEADAYANALLAYWQSDEFGKNGLAKNAVVLFLGVDSSQSSVVWARARTGLPGINGEMVAALATQLAGKPFEPNSLLGRPKASIVEGKPVYSASEGLVDRIMTQDYPYKRPCMDCKDAGESGGFEYLDSEVLLSGWAQTWIIVVGVIVAAVIWWFFAYMPFFEGVHPGRRRQRNSYYQF